MQVRKAIFPVAGLGTRFLPVTKANPKEMLPIVDKPLIQYAVEEAVRAGIEHIIFVTSSGKRSIEDHFDDHFELESRLAQNGRQDLLNLLRSISPVGVQFTYVRQNQPLGLGHAILCAEHVIGNEAFAVLLADDLIDDSVHPCLSALVDYFAQHGNSVFAVQHVPWAHVSQYGVVKFAKQHDDYLKVIDIIEKPKPELAPSNLVAVGRYVFTPQIFLALKKTQRDFRGAIQLTDGMQCLLKYETMQAYRFAGKRYDCGSKLGYLQATVEFALRHPDVGSQFADYLHKLNELATM